jgi:hypothetical protein
MVEVLSQHRKWLDVRHVRTLAWMMVGLIQSGLISLTAWAPYVDSRAKYAQSTVRRFRRWLDNQNIEVLHLYGPLIRQAISEWGENTLYLALDTSMLWDAFCVIRISVIYRGRAIPLVWKVIEHPSSTVSFDVYKDLLDCAARLLPLGCRVVFLADRGFADTKLMGRLTKIGWHWRIRIKSSFLIFRRGRCVKVGRISVATGQAHFWHDVFVTGNLYGPVHFAIGRSLNSNECWVVLSDEPTSFDTFDEYGLRFDIEENFLDDKSNGFQLESSQIRSAEALERLCFVLAVATLWLVSQGTEIVRQGRRRWVDPHWFRGSSYLKIGWNWTKLALSRGYELVSRLCLRPEADPEPAMASKKQRQKRPSHFFTFNETELQKAA